MRSVRRTRAIVPALRRSGACTRAALRQRRQKRAEPLRKLSFTSHWRRPEIRGALIACQGWACVYCGRSLDEFPGDVEHFRPKSSVDGDPSHGGYWWLAYSFHNYFLSCSICNQIYKSNRFPVRDGQRNLRFEDRRNLNQEARLLLDPAAEPMDDLLRVHWRENRCRITPADHLQGDLRHRVARNLELFKVNIDNKLIRRRRDFRDRIRDEILAGKQAAARLRAVRYRPYSLVARQMLLDKNLPLPTPKEECDWLLRRLIRDLLDALETLQTVPNDSVALKQARELRWALAVLWKDPPTGDPADIQDVLAAELLDQKVSSQAAELVLRR